MRQREKEAMEARKSKKQGKRQKPKCSACEKNKIELELLRDIAYEVKNSIPTYELLKRLNEIYAQNN
jgi:hypothetical protein